MHKYFLKIPWWVRKLFPSYVWKVPVSGRAVFLTFDDGPHPTITPWVLRELKKYGAEASFFCIGKNVALYPEIYQMILRDGHTVGNHTYSHLNGWQTPAPQYLADVARAGHLIQSSLFRPPYGRIRQKQAKGLPAAMQKKGVSVIMWDVLSADFDSAIRPKDCARIVLRHVEPGSIVVFHDSEKAFRNLEAALPVVLEGLKARGFVCKKLPEYR